MLYVEATSYNHSVDISYDVSIECDLIKRQASSILRFCVKTFKASSIAYMQITLWAEPTSLGVSFFAFRVLVLATNYAFLSLVLLVYKVLFN